jgi:ureidoacrylate peracid hydrolase
MNIPPITTIDTALLLIDLQNGFLDTNGFVPRSYGGLSPSLAAVSQPAERMLAAARAVGIPIIHTQHAWEPGYRDGGFLVEEILPKQAAAAGLETGDDLVIGSWEADFFPPFTPREGENVIAKNRYDAFIGTRLERLLMRLGIRTLIVGGVVTTICVESTIRDAAMRDFRVYLAVDAVGDVDEAAHSEGLARLSRSFAHPVHTKQICEAWTQATESLPHPALTAG